MNRGSDQLPVIRMATVHASMRPRFMNRGSYIPLARSTVGSYASMRPRFMNRGSSSYDCKRLEAVACFNEAPIHESGKS